MKPLARGLLLAIAYLGFISLGLPDPVAGVAWPSVREAFDLPQSGFGLVFIALGCGYCLSGFFGGTLTRWLGLGNLLWISSGLVAVAMIGSGLAPAWIVFVLCGVVWGLGSGGIDAGLNAYVSRHFPAKHVNWLHACYSLGATVGPLLMTAVLVQAASWRIGYHLVGGLLLAMTALFLVTRRQWDDPAAAGGEPSPTSSLREALRRPLVWLQALLFFLYVGLEFTAGQWSYTLLTESRGVAPELAGGLAAGYFAAIGVGRVISGALADRVGLDPLVRFALLTVFVGCVLFLVSTPVEVGFVGLVVAGLGLAPFFPCLMARTPQRLGPAVSSHAIGFQVSAGMLGAATVPGVAGLLVERNGVAVVAGFALLLAAVLLLTHEGVLMLARRGRIEPSGVPRSREPRTESAAEAPGDGPGRDGPRTE